MKVVGGKYFLYLTIIIGVVIIWFFVRFVLGGSEDDWICVDREWVKHGSPSAPMPEYPCE